MRRANILSGLVASVLLISGTAGSPCKPKTTLQSSETLVSSVTQSSSLESIPTIDDTSSVFETLSSNTAIVEATSTELPSQPTSEVTSGATTETPAFSTVWTTATTETTTDSTTLATIPTEASIDTTAWFTETSTVETTTASEAPPSITTFSLVATNSERSEVNGNILQSSSYNLKLATPLALGSEYQIARFSIEPGTNYLKVGDRYALAPKDDRYRISIFADNNNSRYLVCSEPVVMGQKLSCYAEGSDWNRWAVDTFGYLVFRRELTNPTHRFVDFIVS
ncbi:hypothetical protein NW768_001041 [Fusarium equiseti]|uniref:Uncharacterized protein n=1 Tax=Fusarium equiseti TaxID=61235 RepID=A0ABQ8RQ06_FUSEQ|nr:hypothetical protein NW768_001041 [Fusarium equiseti]